MRTARCPSCQALHDDLPDATSWRDLIFCEYCGAFAFVDQQGRLRKPNARGLAYIETVPRCLEMRREWRERGRKPKGPGH